MLAQIQSLIEQALPGAIVKAESEDGVHYTVSVMAEQFRGLSRLKQQQLVYQALGEHITSGRIHALAMKTSLPDV